MKHLALTLVLLFTAGSLAAGDGKHCDMSKAAKAVTLTGTLDGRTFHVANSDKTYTVCEKTKNAVLKLGANGATIEVKGKLMSCDESDGEELVIEDAKKV
jgi:hypothetical protein